MRKPSQRQLIRACAVVAVAGAAGSLAPPLAAAIAAGASEVASLADQLTAQSREAADFRRLVEEEVVRSTRHLSKEDLTRGLENAFALLQSFRLTSDQLVSVAYDSDSAATLVMQAAIAAGRIEYRDYSEDPTVIATTATLRAIYAAMKDLPANRGEVWTGLNDALVRIRVLEQVNSSRPDPPARHVRTIWEPDPLFRGMTEPLSQLTEALDLGGVAEAATVAISGIAGAGKTMLAMQFAALNADTIQNLHVLDGSDAEAFALSYEREFGAPPRLAQPPFRSPLPGGPNDLVIVDGVTNREAVIGKLPANGQCRVLVTCTCDLSADYRSIELDGWDVQEALNYVREVWAGPRQGDEQLVDTLGRNPLALAQAADYCKALGLTPEAYLDRLSKVPQIVLDAGIAPRYSRTVLKALKLSLDRLQEVSPLAMDVLRIAAHLSSDPIPLAYFRDICMLPVLTFGPAEIDGEVLHDEAHRIVSELSDPAAFDSAILFLRSARLTPSQEVESIQPHSLVRALVRSSASAHAYVVAAHSLFIRADDYSLMRPAHGTVAGRHLLALVRSAHEHVLWGYPTQVMAWSALESMALLGDDEDFTTVATTVLWFVRDLDAESPTDIFLVRESQLAVAAGLTVIGDLEAAESLCDDLIRDLKVEEANLHYWVARLATIVLAVESRELAERALTKLQGELAPAVREDEVWTASLLNLHYAAAKFDFGSDLAGSEHEGHESRNVRSLRAMMLGLQGRHEEAHRELEEILRGMPTATSVGEELDFAKIALDLVESCLTQRHYDHVRNLFREIEERWPLDLGDFKQVARSMMARLLAYRGWYELDQYLSTASDRPQEGGIASSNSLASAKALLEDAVEQFDALPRNRQGALAGALYHLALIAVMQGDDQGALPLAIRAEELDTWALGPQHYSTLESRSLLTAIRERMSGEGV